MAKDTTTIVFGIIYCICVGLSWLSIIAPFYAFTPGGLFGFIGNLFLIPSLILYLIFIFSDEGHTSASVGFGLGVPGWVLGLFGQILGIIIGFFSPSTIWLIAFYTTLTVFGSLLFARRHKWEEDISPISSTRTRATLPSTATPGPPCPNCNRATRYIPQYSRYYCDSCQKYT